MLTPKLSHIGLMKTLPKVTKSTEAQKMPTALSRPGSGKCLLLTLEQQQAALLKKMIKAQTVGYANDPRSKRTVLVEDKTGVRVLGLDGKDITRPIPVTYKSVAFSLADFVNMLASPQFERLIPHMYLDTGGSVTIGIGHLIRNASEAKKLHTGSLPFRWQKGKGSGAVTDADVAADYSRVIGAGAGRQAGSYLTFTKLEVDDSAVRTLALTAATARLNAFKHSGRYPEFSSYPVEAQMVIIDMVYNLGLSGFFSGFPKFENAVKHRDWRSARAESTRTSAGKPLAERNLATAALLDKAARKPSERYFISTDPKVAKSVKIVTPSGSLMTIRAP